MSPGVPAAAAMAYHAAHLTPDPARAAVWGAIAAHLAPWIPREAHVLEIGAGYCDWINQVQAARRVAVDVWPDVARHAGPGVEALVLDAASGLSTVGDAAFRQVAPRHAEPHQPGRLGVARTRAARHPGIRRDVVVVAVSRHEDGPRPA